MNKCARARSPAAARSSTDKRYEITTPPPRATAILDNGIVDRWVGIDVGREGAKPRVLGDGEARSPGSRRVPPWRGSSRGAGAERGEGLGRPGVRSPQSASRRQRAKSDELLVLLRYGDRWAAMVGISG
jgi:hypothetical protein